MSFQTFSQELCRKDWKTESWWRKATPEALLKSLEEQKIKDLPCNPIFDVAADASPEVVKIFLEQGGNSLVNTQLHGWTPLAMAIEYQKKEEYIEPIVRLLVAHGANLGHTPFGTVVDSRLPPGPGRSI